MRTQIAGDVCFNEQKRHWSVYYCTWGRSQNTASARSSLRLRRTCGHLLSAEQQEAGHNTGDRRRALVSPAPSLAQMLLLAREAQFPLWHTPYTNRLPHPLLTLRAAASSAVSKPVASPGFSCRCLTPLRPGCRWQRWEPAPHPARSSCFSSRLSPQNTSLVPPPARTPSCNKLWLSHPTCFFQLATCWECIIYRYKSVSPFASQYRSLIRQISKVLYCKDCKNTSAETSQIVPYSWCIFNAAKHSCTKPFLMFSSGVKSLIVFRSYRLLE